MGTILSVLLSFTLLVTPAFAQNVGAPGSYGSTAAEGMNVDRGANTQTGNQQGNYDNGRDGGDRSKGLASNLFAIAIGLIASGVAANAASPPCHCAGMPLIAAGIFFNQGGQGASGAGDQMYNMAGISDYYRGNLSGVNDLGSTPKAIDISQAATGSSKNGEVGVGGLKVDNSADADRINTNFKIDEDSLRNGKLGAAFDSLEKNLGIDRREFAEAILRGDNVSDLLSRKNALFGKSAADLDAELASQKLDPDELREKLENGEYDDYKGALGASQAGEGIDNSGEGAGAKGTALAGNGKTYDQLMAEIFGKKGESTLKDLMADGKIVSDALKNDAQLRALASNNKYNLSTDYVMDGKYGEKTLFQRVNRVYKEKSDAMLPEDFFIRMQAERDMQRFR